MKSVRCSLLSVFTKVPETVTYPNVLRTYIKKRYKPSARSEVTYYSQYMSSRFSPSLSSGTPLRSVVLPSWDAIRCTTFEPRTLLKDPHRRSLSIFLIVSVPVSFGDFRGTTVRGIRNENAYLFLTITTFHFSLMTSIFFRKFPTSARFPLSLCTGEPLLPSERSLLSKKCSLCSKRTMFDNQLLPQQKQK